MNWLSLIGAILGTTERVIPVVVHDPSKDHAAAVIVTTAEAATQMVQQISAAKPPAGVTPQQ